MKKAWIENNIVRDICQGEPLEYFHPDIAKNYNTDVPDDVEVGAELIDGEWVNPAPIEPVEPEIVYEKVSPIEFKMLFTMSERLAINPLKQSDEIIKDWFEILDDARLTFVDLGLKSTQDALSYLVTLEILTEDRRLQILRNEKI